MMLGRVKGEGYPVPVATSIYSPHMLAALHFPNGRHYSIFLNRVV